MKSVEIYGEREMLEDLHELTLEFDKYTTSAYNFLHWQERNRSS